MIVKNLKKHKFGYLGGTFSKEELTEAKEKSNPLTLDMAIPGTYLNNCFYCGYKDTQSGRKLNLQEIKRIIKDFSKLGGKSIKILGEGEPLLRKDIFEIFDCIHRSNIQPVLFTCGDTIGDDDLAQKVHKMNGIEIAKRLKDLQTTIMLKYDAKNQDEIVQRKGFSKKRNLALEKLINLGFNKYSPTRLGFGIVILRNNFREIPENYEIAIKNNIYPLLCPIMPIGKASDSNYREKIGITKDEMIELSVQLYGIAQKHNINIQCPADFPGGLPCDIARAGFYIADTGGIYLCESEEKIGNIREGSLDKAWQKINQIKDKKYKDRWRGFCYTKRAIGILPQNFEKIVSDKLTKK